VALTVLREEEMKDVVEDVVVMIVNVALPRNHPVVVVVPGVDPIRLLLLVNVVVVDLILLEVVAIAIDHTVQILEIEAITILLVVVAHRLREIMVHHAAVHRLATMARHKVRLLLVVVALER
jgi:hypothetical protein